MRMQSFFVAPMVAALALTGCATDGPREQAGTIIGGVLGGVLGAQVGGGHGRTVAIIAGALAGAAIGGSVGESMDDNDRRKVAETLEGVRTGVPAAWINPDTGVQYSVTPTRTYDTATGPCREFATEAIIGGRRETVFGTACRQADGSWQVMN
ncbi:MAG TPA: RT0821/Lpp0805 family surface protein [Thiobacillus sp.]|nr:RT0821/Lpp0805 family surface protein [Thiobacillus sp.]